MYRFFLLFFLAFSLSADAQRSRVEPDTLFPPVQLNATMQNKNLLNEIKQKQIYHSLADSTAVLKYISSKKKSITKKNAAGLIYELAKGKYMAQLKEYNNALGKRLEYNKRVETLKKQIEKLVSEKKKYVASGNKQKAIETDTKLKFLLQELDKITDKETYVKDHVKTQENQMIKIGNELKSAKDAYDHATDDILSLGK